MPKRTDIKKVMVIGSGPIVIGQAAEFDYAGTQACLALKEEGYEVILVNSNPATIMTDTNIADKVYMEPLTLEYVAKIVRYERPDAIVPGLGGQTGLNLAVQLAKKGVLDECHLIFGEDFKGQFPSSEMILRQGEESLVYPYSEERIAFFNSGKVDILLATGEKSRVLLSRNLEPNEILTISFSVDLTDVTGVDFGIAIDTGRVWVSEKYVYGKERDGSVKSRALKVSDLPNMTGSEGVWVQGYIVGGDLSSSSATYAAPFTSRTNLMISESQSVGSREGCASVELKSGGVRDSLNLVDHPQWLGKMVYLKGNIVESYFGLVGIKNVSEYTFN